MSGFDTTALARLRTAIEGDIELGRYDGAVVLVARDGEVGMLEAIGSRSRCGAPGADRRRLPRAARSRRRHERARARGGRARSLRVDLQGRRRHPGVPRFRPLPRMRKAAVTVKHLLTHSAALPGTPYPLPPLAAGRPGRHGRRDLRDGPHGTSPGPGQYSPALNHALLGEMVRRTMGGGRRLRDVLREELIEPWA